MYTQPTSGANRAGVKPVTSTTTAAQPKDRVSLSWTPVETHPHGRKPTASWSLPNQSRRLAHPVRHGRSTVNA